MKTLKYIIALLLISTHISCEDDFLDPAPTSVLSGANFFTSPEQVESAVINIYDGIQGVNSTSPNDNHSIQVEFYLTEMRSDNTRTKSQEGEAAQFEFYTIEANNGIVADYYASFYNVVYLSLIHI